MLPGLVVSIVSLAVVFYFADLDEIGQALRLADYRLVALSALLSLTWLLVRGQVWRTLLQNKPTFSQSFFTVNEGYLLNNVLPFRLGELGRVYLMSKKAHLGFWAVFSSVLLERVLDLAMAAGLLLSTLPFVVGATWAREAAIVAAGLVVLGLFILYLLARYRDWAMRLFNRWMVRWPRLREMAGERLDAFFNGLTVITNTRLFLLAIGWMLLNWLVSLVQYYVMLGAFFDDPEFIWAAFSLGVAAMGIAAPSSPGAVGVMEISLVGALALFRLDSSTALAFAFTTHLIQYLLTGVLGAYGLFKDGQSLTGLYRQVLTLREKSPAGIEK